jgi:DUF971 family protein
MTAEDYTTEHWPTEIRLRKQEKILEIDFDDGSRFALPAELLRVESPSAEVQGHGPSQKTLIAGRRHVGIMAVEPVGNYAVKLHFDDMHNTGIFSWAYLHKLGREHAGLWAGSLGELEERGLSRRPAAGR